MITPEMLQEMAIEAMRRAPREACGVVCSGGVVRHLTNGSVTPESRFEVLDSELLDVYMSCGAIEAVWHSHPGGSSEMSDEDKAVMRGLGVPAIIVSLSGVADGMAGSGLRQVKVTQWVEGDDGEWSAQP